MLTSENPSSTLSAGDTSEAKKTGADRKMDVSRYDERARGVNAPIYVYYAEKIKHATGITSGVCLDVGCGGGYLGLALARITDLNFIFMDRSAAMLERADRHIIEDSLQGRARTLLGDVHRIPLEDSAFNLVISRRPVRIATRAVDRCLRRHQRG